MPQPCRKQPAESAKVGDGSIVRSAPLQRCIILSTSVGTLAGATGLADSGRTLWAAALLCLPFASFAAVLAVEFVLMRAVHVRTDPVIDPTPKAAPRLLLSAWWAELKIALRAFCWQQPFFSQSCPDFVSAHVPDVERKRGVLLVHGFACNRGLWNPWLERLQLTNTPFVAVNLEPLFGSISDYVDTLEAAVRRLESATGLPPVVVAHSMGGLAVRCWWAQQNDQDRIHHAISLGSPHRGTWLARFAMTRNSRQMGLKSPWLANLANAESTTNHSRWTCFYSHCDNIVFPPLSATLTGADNQHLPGVAHLHMIDSPEPWEELLRWLSSPERSS